MESRPLSGRRPRPLRRLPHAEERVRRRPPQSQPSRGGLVDGWFAPRLDAAERSGLRHGGRGHRRISASGRNAKSHAGGPMAEVVVNSTSKMSDADLRAIAVYLKSLPSGKSEPLVTPPSDAAMASGKAVYDRYCVACHEADGSSSPRRLSAAARQRATAIGRSVLDAAHHPRRRADRDHAARAEHRTDAGLCAAIQRSGDRRRHDLYPQHSATRAGRDRGAGHEGAAAVAVLR